MKNYWKLVKIGDIGEVVGGGTPSTKCSDYYGGDIPWITPKDLSNFRNRYISRGERMISKLGLENSSARMLPPFSVLFTSRAPIGYIAIAKNELCTNQGFKSIIPDPKKCNALFLYYLLKYKKNDIELIANGSTFQEVSGTALKNFEVSIPPLDEQRKIAGILSALDDKIELNNKINRNLEAQAQAIFKSWFIDFEPFKNGKFIDSELGRIPEGWSVSKLTNSLNIKYGKNLPQSKLTKTGYPVYGANGQIGFFPQIMYKKPQVLISCRGAASGKVITSEKNSFITNNSLILDYSDTTIPFSFVKYWALSTDFSPYVSGSAQPQITIDSLSTMNLTIPDEIILKKFNNIVIPILDKIFSNNAEIIRLSQLRDILLPRLLSGEINISDYIA